MNKRSVLELTPLLDIILILLFAFMLNVNANEQSAQDEKLALLKENTELTKTVQELLTNQENLQTQIAQMQFYHNKEKQTLQTLTKGIARFLETEQKEVDILLQEAESRVEDQELAAVLQRLISPEHVVKELWRHETLARRFYFIEVGLQHNHNQLYINTTPTKVTIHHEELKTALGRSQKKELIKDSIVQTINEREGGVGMMILSLTLLDEEVYQYAYELTWEAIKELQEKYGTDKMFITEYTFLNSGVGS